MPDLGIQPPAPLTPAEMCPPGQAHNEEDVIAIDERNRVFVRRRWWRGQLIEFVMIQFFLIDGEWIEILRADTCHKEVHIHHLTAEGGKERREVVGPITDFASVGQGYAVCEDRIFDHLEANVRQWGDV